MSKVFVTGADGMLGSSICRVLLEKKYEVKALSLDESYCNSISDLPIDIVYGNILDEQVLKNEILGCDYVIHVAALAQVWPRRAEKILDVNIGGTETIARVAEEFNIKRMVHIGSAASFSEGTKDNPGNETNEYSGWRFGMDYIDSKYLAQKALLAKYEDSGFPVVIINPTYMIGPFDSGPSSGKMIIELFKGSIPGYSGGGKNFVCSVDVANAAVNALTKGRIGECYIAGNQNLDYKEFLSKVSGNLGRKFTLKKVPQPLILLAGLFKSVLARLINTVPEFSYGMARFAALDQYYSPCKAIRELDMPQTPIEYGVESALEWFMENGYLTEHK